MSYCAFLLGKIFEGSKISKKHCSKFLEIVVALRKVALKQLLKSLWDIGKRTKLVPLCRIWL